MRSRKKIRVEVESVEIESRGLGYVLVDEEVLGLM